MIQKKIVLITFLITAGFNNLSAQSKLYDQTFDLKNITITNGPFKHACELNIETLLQYDVDKLLAPYLREAGLNTITDSYNNWEKDGLDGHIGGHYLSALALHFATTQNKECKARLDYMVSELKRCQSNSKNGKGYIGGVPVNKIIDNKNCNLWTELRNGNIGVIWKYWVPWYNIHKIYAGLRDAWLYGENNDAKLMFIELCDWGVEFISNLDDNQIENMLANEFGGMNEIFADAYKITGEEKYILAAKKFNHKEIFESMKNKIDNLDNKHANTQVPKAVGYQRIAEVYNDSDNNIAANFFWETVVNNRTLAVGGNSRREIFPSAKDCCEYMDERQGPESCNTYNMMKLSAGLFRMDDNVKYIDFYERAMYNHILSTQHPEHGGYVYFTPARPAHYRVYSAAEKAMWCCVGTGMENHAKYGELIYTHNNDELYVNLFIPSKLKWDDKDLEIEQKTEFPYDETNTIKVSLKESKKLNIKIRYPLWIEDSNMSVIVNGINYAKNYKPGSYIEINRVWSNNDEIIITTPMKFRVEEMPNVQSAIAIMRGPILMGARVNSEGLDGIIANDNRWAHIAHGKLISKFDAPRIIEDREIIIQKLNNADQIGKNSLKFIMPEGLTQKEYNNLILEPFYGIHDCRYMMYWMSMTKSDYSDYVRRMELDEKEKLILDKRTIDAVKPGEQQPESDHNFISENTNKGTRSGETWRQANENGYFEYNLSTSNKSDLSLMVRFWGNETEKKGVNIYIDDIELISQNVSMCWEKDEFINIEYKIPNNLLKDKNRVKIKFSPKYKSHKTGEIYDVRLLAPKNN